MLSQKIMLALFGALDLAEKVVAMVKRLRGRPVSPPPWARHTAPTTPVAPQLAALETALRANKWHTLSKDAQVGGRTMLARMVWALAAAHKFLERGLTGGEMASVLGWAGVKTLPNNILRAVREDGGLLFKKAPCGQRAVRLQLTARGREHAARLGWV